MECLGINIQKQSVCGWTSWPSSQKTGRMMKCTLLFGTFVELVDCEVVPKQKELLVNTVIGVLKTKTESLVSRAVPQARIALPCFCTAHLCSVHGVLGVWPGVSSGQLSLGTMCWIFKDNLYNDIQL